MVIMVLESYLKGRVLDLLSIRKTEVVAPYSDK